MDCTVHSVLKARVLEWVAILFSRGSSLPRDQTRVSCIAGRFFTNWAAREAPVALNERELVFRKTQLLRLVRLLLGDLIWVGLGKYVKKLESWDKFPSPQVLLCKLDRGVEMHVTCPTGICENIPVVKADQLPSLTEMFPNWSSQTMLYISAALKLCHLTYNRQYRHPWYSAIFWSISWYLFSQTLNLFIYTLRASSLSPKCSGKQLPCKSEEEFKIFFFTYTHFSIVLRAGEISEISKQILNFQYGNNLLII